MFHRFPSQLALAFAATCLVVPAACGQDELLLSDFVGFNQAGIDRIRTLDVTCDVYSVKSNSTPAPLNRVRWAVDFDQQLERVRKGLLADTAKVITETFPEGDFQFHDLLVRNNNWQLMRNWDPEWGVEVPLRLDSRVSGFIGVVGKEFPGGYDPRSLLLWRFSTPATSLSEAVSRLGSELLDDVVDSLGNKCVAIGIPADHTRTPISFAYKVFLDPRNGFAIREIAADSLPVSVDEKEMVVSVRSRVESFKELDDSVFLPVSVLTTRSDSKFDTRTVFKYNAVNGPLDKGVFDVDFPANLRVMEMETTNVMIADGSGGYQMEWSKPEDMVKWYAENHTPGMVSGSPDMTSSRLLFIVSSFVLLAIVLIIMVLKKRSRNL